MKTKYDAVTVGGGDGDLVLDDDGAGDDVVLGYDMATPMPVLMRKKEGTKMRGKIVVAVVVLLLLLDKVDLRRIHRHRRQSSMVA